MLENFINTSRMLLKKTIYLAIVEKPLNIGSELCHKNLGYRKQAEFLHPDDKKRGIWG